MASMNFDKKTVCDIMSLIDENKDDINEASYIKMCNAMRSLHQLVSQMETTPSSQSYNTTTPPTGQTTNNNVTLPQLTSLREDITTQINQMETALRNWPNRLMPTDKYTAIVMHLPDIFNISGIDETLNIASKIKEMETYVLSNNLISKRDIKKAYDEQKIIRINDEKISTQNRLERFIVRLSSVDSQIATM